MAEFPEVFVIDEETEDGAANELGKQVRSVDVERPFVIASVHGARLAGGIEGQVGTETPSSEADQSWAADLGSRVHESGADAIVAIGGGRCIDIAKLAATRAGLKIVVVPTQLSHDGISSPVAVVPDASGRTESLGAIAPIAIMVSLPTLQGAPARAAAAGIGDLLANPLALRDWTLASERGLEELDDRAWDLSVESHELIAELIEVAPATAIKDRDHVRRLADALVLSGMAMIAAGTSRPASGGEHEISHAIDEIHGGRGMHGAQVAFGCIVSLALYDEDTDGFRSTLRTLGLPQEPGELGLTNDELVHVLAEAPNTRPGRFTILEEANLDEGELHGLVKRIWS